MAISKYGNYIGKPVKGIRRTQLTLKEELRDALDNYAKEHNMKITHVIEELIKKYIVNSNQDDREEI